MNRVKQLTDLLGIRYPIIQAPMAGGITTPDLVASVSDAGGLGSFGAAYMRPDELRQAIRSVTSRTTASYQVNLFVPEAVDLSASAPRGRFSEIAGNLHRLRR
jgi:nitronate monooxygenase